MDSTVLLDLLLAFQLSIISWIDFQRFVIPDILNLSLALCGFVVSEVVLDKTIVGILIESGLAVAVFLAIRKAYSSLRGKHGIGAGDVKFLGAAATWVGLAGIPWVILIASISGLMFAVAESIRGGEVKTDSRLAFGPHLSLGLMITWLLRDVIVVHAWR